MNYRNVTLGKGTLIAPNATIVGNVTMGENCLVLHGAALRGDYGRAIVIGDRTNVQENVCIHVNERGNTVIGSGVTIGHGAIVHGCTIGNDTLIGMGSIILDGARVGNNCLVAAGALVSGTADIPDGHLAIGSPARALRLLSDEEIQGLKNDAAEYVEVAADMHANGLLSAVEEIPADHPTIALRP